MGSCRFCGRKAGLFRKVHRDCRKGFVLNMNSLMVSTRFKEAALAAEELIVIDPDWAPLGHYVLSTIYFAAIHDSTEAADPNAAEQARILFHGLEDNLRTTDPATYHYLYDQPSSEESDEEIKMRQCTLEHLGHTYAEARRKAEHHTLAVLEAAGDRSEEWNWSQERLATLRMMDEMYGPAGDEGDTLSRYSFARSARQPEDIPLADVLEEMILIKHFTRWLISGSDKIRGSERTILRKKLVASLTLASKRVFPVSDGGGMKPQSDDGLITLRWKGLPPAP